MKKHKIARLVVLGNPYENNPKRLLNKFIKQNDDKHFEFVITPGGFLEFDFPDALQGNVKIEVDKIDDKQLQLLIEKAKSEISSFFKSLRKSRYEKLKEIADYITIGIDGYNSTGKRGVELIAIYSLKETKVIRWTGKFYPTERQKRRLIKFNDLESHFIELNNQKVLILGCHDLNAYSPRGQAVAKPRGYKKEIAKKIRSLNKKYQPDIVLQHPHTTDTPNIWSQPWNALVKELPSVKHYASAINYFNWNGQQRRDLDTVLEKTKQGDVVDFYYKSIF